ncbi:MAG: helix-turn-helix domain-containing protein [Micromonosporaceae bacterium]|nr:helix-turn-helix domain-containing protein [Micromonosporaceae bacterium]
MDYDRPEPSDLIRSVSRALRVLEAIGGSSDGLLAKQIARQCGLSLATTYHLVRTLEYEGYLIRLQDGRYVVGLALSDRFRELAAVFRAPDTVEESMRRLAGDTGYSHFLARFVQGRVAITAVTEGRRTPHLEDLIVGFDDGAHATALGKALLATLTPEERRRYVRAFGMRRFTRATLTNPEALEADLARYAAEGVYFELGQYRDGLACAGTLVRDHADPARRVVVACAIPISDAVRMGAAAIRVSMHQAAAGLRAAMDGGYGPGPVAL